MLGTQEESFSFFAFVKNVPQTEIKTAIEACYAVYDMKRKILIDYNDLKTLYEKRIKYSL